jgi:hypothetical protein
MAFFDGAGALDEHSLVKHHRSEVLSAIQVDKITIN